MSSPYMSDSYCLSLQNRVASDQCGFRDWQGVIYQCSPSPPPPITISHCNATYVMPYQTTWNSNSKTENKGNNIWARGGPNTPY